MTYFSNIGVPKVRRCVKSSPSIFVGQVYINSGIHQNLQSDHYARHAKLNAYLQNLELLRSNRVVKKTPLSNA